MEANPDFAELSLHLVKTGISRLPRRPDRGLPPCSSHSPGCHLGSCRHLRIGSKPWPFPIQSVLASCKSFGFSPPFWSDEHWISFRLPVSRPTLGHRRIACMSPGRLQAVEPYLVFPECSEVPVGQLRAPDVDT